MRVIKSAALGQTNDWSLSGGWAGWAGWAFVSCLGIIPEERSNCSPVCILKLIFLPKDLCKPILFEWHHCSPAESRYLFVSTVKAIIVPYYPRTGRSALLLQKTCG